MGPEQRLDILARRDLGRTQLEAVGEGCAGEIRVDEHGRPTSGGEELLGGLLIATTPRIGQLDPARARGSEFS
jgi:hypothetical protein